MDLNIASKALAFGKDPSKNTEIIHFNHNAFVKERKIFDAIMTIGDVVEYTR